MVWMRYFIQQLTTLLLLYRYCRHKDPKMKISAVILSYNSIAYIEKCITFLIDSVQEFDLHEVFIVDNGSTDGSVEQISSLEERFPGVVGIYFEKSNFSANCSKFAA